MSSSEEISEICVFLFLGGLLDLLLGLFDLLLGLLFLRSLLLFSGLGGSCGGGASEASLSFGDELMEGLSSDGLDDLVDFFIGGVGLNASEEGFKILCICVDEGVLISFLPERARRA